MTLEKIDKKKSIQILLIQLFFWIFPLQSMYRINLSYMKSLFSIHTAMILRKIYNILKKYFPVSILKELNIVLINIDFFHSLWNLLKFVNLQMIAPMKTYTNAKKKIFSNLKTSKIFEGISQRYLFFQVLYIIWI